MNKWYVVQTKPKKESHVAKLFGLAGLESLCPKVKSFARGIQPLFPNYIFLRWDLSLAQNFHMIKFTRGVSRVLGLQGSPLSISDEAIQVIQERINQDQILEHQTMKVGSRVQVKRGILRDLIGVLEKPVSAEGRVAVLLSLYEREMKAVLNCEDVALVA